MQAGLLRKRVLFQTRSTTADTFGGQSTAWVDAFTVSAEVAPLSGRELLSAQAVQSEVSHQITARYRPEFSDPKAVARMRAFYNGRYFNIHASINLDERNRQVTLSASEGLNDG